MNAPSTRTPVRRLRLEVEYDLTLDRAFINGIEIANRDKLWDVFRLQALLSSGPGRPHAGNDDPRLRESLEEYEARGGTITRTKTAIRKELKKIKVDDLDLEL